MITTRIYQLDTRSTPWDTAHLFEHLIILMARDHLDEKGFSRDLVGWISGTTFDERLFLEAGFYQLKAAKIFDEFIHSTPKPTDSQIKHAVATVEAEEKAYLVVDFDKLRHDVLKLSAMAWVKGERQAKADTFDNNIRLQPSAKDFRDITIMIGAEALSAEEQKVFLRLRVIILDIVANKLSTDFMAYSHGYSQLYRRDDTCKFISTYTVSGLNGRLASLSDELANYLNNYPTNHRQQELATHFETFASEPLWQESIVTYFRYSGIVTTVEEILALATPDSIESIFKKLKVHARTSKSSDQSLLY